MKAVSQADLASCNFDFVKLVLKEPVLSWHILLDAISIRMCESCWEGLKERLLTANILFED